MRRISRSMKPLRTLGLTSLSAVLLLGCSKAKHDEPAPTTATPVPTPALTPTATSAKPAIDAAPERTDNKIELSIKPARAKAPSTAVRCAVEGDPLDGKDQLSLATASDGALYVSDAVGFRRFRPNLEQGCKLQLDRSFGKDGVLAFPTAKSKAQPLDAERVYVRSGGPQWKLASDGKQGIYAFDYLLGVYRIDHNRAEPICPDVQGVDSIAVVSSGLYFGGAPVRKANLRGKCSVVELKGTRGKTYAIGEQLWHQTDDKTLTALDANGHATEISITSKDSFAPGGFCYASAVTACGDKLCVVDNNCKKIEIYNRDGSFAAELKDNLFDQFPYGLPTGTSAGDAGLWLVATYHEANVYEGAVFLVPASEL